MRSEAPEAPARAAPATRSEAVSAAAHAGTAGVRSDGEAHVLPSLILHVRLLENANKLLIP